MANSSIGAINMEVLKKRKDRGRSKGERSQTKGVPDDLS